MASGILQSKLFGVRNGYRMDTRAQTAPARGNPALEAVGEVNWTTDTRREKPGKSQCLPWWIVVATEVSERPHYCASQGNETDGDLAAQEVSQHNAGVTSGQLANVAGSNAN